MPQSFDRVMRENFREASVTMLNKLFGWDVKEVRALPTKLHHTTVERETDILFVVTTNQDTQFIAHIEWQTTNDPEMCRRMLFYHALIYNSYKIEVRGYVMYLGPGNIHMENSVEHGLLRYAFELIDPRQIQIDVFLSSDKPEEVLLAILTGPKKTGRDLLIQQILDRLEELLQDNKPRLLRLLKQFEILSILRNENIVIKTNEQFMALTTEIFHRDIRFQEGLKKGEMIGEARGVERGEALGAERGALLAKEQLAVAFLQSGISIDIVAKNTGFSKARLRKLLHAHAAKKI